MQFLFISSFSPLQHLIQTTEVNILLNQRLGEVNKSSTSRSVRNPFMFVCYAVVLRICYAKSYQRWPTVSRSTTNSATQKQILSKVHWLVWNDIARKWQETVSKNLSPVPPPPPFKTLYHVLPILIIND